MFVINIAGFATLYQFDTRLHGDPFGQRGFCISFLHSCIVRSRLLVLACDLNSLLIYENCLVCRCDFLGGFNRSTGCCFSLQHPQSADRSRMEQKIARSRHELPQTLFFSRGIG